MILIVTPVTSFFTQIYIKKKNSIKIKSSYLHNTNLPIFLPFIVIKNSKNIIKIYSIRAM